mmetsp:Transcript_6321/g.9202  ORF Transcript_6321/g.9202 Transcript_6321/m.9202 type:complete len:200 (+) Transcript_6321:46-645(+)
MKIIVIIFMLLLLMMIHNVIGVFETFKPEEFHHDELEEDFIDYHTNIHVQKMDHFSLTVRDIDDTLKFYQQLGFDVVKYTTRYKKIAHALTFNGHRINIESVKDRKFPSPKSHQVGSSQFCFIVTTPINNLIDIFTDLNIPVLYGPVIQPSSRTNVKLISIYIHDMDGNLLEFSNYQDQHLTSSEKLFLHIKSKENKNT